MISSDREQFETVIVGGGQAGLATGYHLAKGGRSFVILDANPRVGDSWRNRWDSLSLLTPARYSGLPGWPFPAAGGSYPGKDDVADYLEAYARRFELPIRSSVRVELMSRELGRYVLETSAGRFESDSVVVASGAYGRVDVPSFASDLSPDIRQLESTQYRDPSQVGKGGVLVVGAGNSGAEIAHDLARVGETWLAGDETGQLPFRHGGVVDRLLTPPFWFFINHVLTTRNPFGRKARMTAIKGHPLEQVRANDLAEARVQRVPRVEGVRDGLPLLADGRTIDVATVIWCTGFRPDFDWIDLPAFDDHGEPLHERGVVDGEPGLYFVGRPFLFALTSSLIGGVGRDARYIVEQILRRETAKQGELA